MWKGSMCTAGHLMRCAILQPFRPCLGGFVSLVSTFGRVLLAYSSHVLGMSDFGLQEALIMGGQNFTCSGCTYTLVLLMLCACTV